MLADSWIPLVFCCLNCISPPNFCLPLCLECTCGNGNFSTEFWASRNKRVCIDLSCWMVQLQNVNRTHCAMKEKLYLRGLFHRLRALIALNCSLIFVTGITLFSWFLPTPFFLFLFLGTRSEYFSLLQKGIIIGIASACPVLGCRFPRQNYTDRHHPQVSIAYYKHRIWLCKQWSLLLSECNEIPCLPVATQDRLWHKGHISRP